MADTQKTLGTTSTNIDPLLNLNQDHEERGALYRSGNGAVEGTQDRADSTGAPEEENRSQADNDPRTFNQGQPEQPDKNG